MHTALSYTATLDPSSAATCAPPPAHARAHSLAHRTRQARVPRKWSCARALSFWWITRIADSTNLRRADVQHENCARAHGIRRPAGPAVPRDAGGADAFVIPPRSGADGRHCQCLHGAAPWRERKAGPETPWPECRLTAHHASARIFSFILSHHLSTGRRCIITFPPFACCAVM